MDRQRRDRLGRLARSVSGPVAGTRSQRTRTVRERSKRAVRDRISELDGNLRQVFITEAGEQGDQLLRQAPVQALEVVASLVSDEDTRSEMELVSKPLPKEAPCIWAERECRSLAISALIDDDRLVLYRCLPSAAVHTKSMRPRRRGSNVAFTASASAASSRRHDRAVTGKTAGPVGARRARPRSTCSAPGPTSRLERGHRAQGSSSIRARRAVGRYRDIGRAVGRSCCPRGCILVSAHRLVPLSPHAGLHNIGKRERSDPLHSVRVSSLDARTVGEHLLGAVW